MRNLCELKAHVLIATARTSGRTSPPKTGIPAMWVTRICICPFSPFATLQHNPGTLPVREGVVNNVVRPSPRAEARGIFCQPRRRGASPIRVIFRKSCAGSFAVPGVYMARRSIIGTKEGRR